MVDVTEPGPREGEVLIRVHATSLCGTDLHIYDWHAWAGQRMRELPVTLGHEFAGEVVSRGKGVTSPPEGTLVAAESHIPCGECHTCAVGRVHLCARLRLVGLDVDGGFAEYARLPASNAVVLPEEIPRDVAPLLEPFGNAVHAAFGSQGDSNISTSTVVVMGCGPIGLFAIAILRECGAQGIVAIEPNERRRSMAKEMGADLLVDPTDADPVDAVLEETQGVGVDIVLEMSGSAASLDLGAQMLSRGGRLSLLGIPADRVSLDLTNNVIFKGARVEGIFGRELFRTWQQSISLLMPGRIDLSPIITHRYTLEDFHSAIETARSGHCGKVLLVPTGGA